MRRRRKETQRGGDFDFSPGRPVVYYIDGMGCGKSVNNLKADADRKIKLLAEYSPGGYDYTAKRWCAPYNGMLRVLAGRLGLRPDVSEIVNEILADAMGSRVLVLGHSYGGLVACLVALKLNELVIHGDDHDRANIKRVWIRTLGSIWVPPPPPPFWSPLEYVNLRHHMFRGDISIRLNGLDPKQNRADVEWYHPPPDFVLGCPRMFPEALCIHNLYEKYVYPKVTEEFTDWTNTTTDDRDKKVNLDKCKREERECKKQAGLTLERKERERRGEECELRGEECDNQASSTREQIARERDEQDAREREEREEKRIARAPLPPAVGGARGCTSRPSRPRDQRRKLPGPARSAAAAP
jgi:hypothetical protein